MTRKILLVDDEEDFLDVFGTWLQHKGFEVVKARDGEQALDKVRHEKFDMVILDLMMPRFSGYDFCKTVRDEESLRGVPILILSAVPKSDAMHRKETYGIAGYLEKVADQAEIATTIDAAFASAKEAEQDMKNGSKSIH